MGGNTVVRAVGTSPPLQFAKTGRDLVLQHESHPFGMVKSLGYSRRTLQPGSLMISRKVKFIDHGQVCCHNNPHVGFFALDALRQLAMRFLEKEELSHFKFQKDFLKPFEYTMIHNPNPAVRDMVSLHSSLPSTVADGNIGLPGPHLLPADDSSQSSQHAVWLADDVRSILCRIQGLDWFVSLIFT